MLNILTVDVEDYFHVSAFEACISPTQWDSMQLRVVDNTFLLLDLLDENDVRATFFILGWVAEKKPGLVREIARRGHEVASHGYGHRRVCTLTRQEFRDDIRRTKVLLEDIIGEKILGYRAPSYSISRDCFWAFDELYDAGFQYDSSVFPIRHDLYGIPDWPCYPFVITKENNDQWNPSTFFPSLSPPLLGDNSDPDNRRRLLEVPITTLTIAGRRIPIAGGGYFRFFPYRFTRWGLEIINNTDDSPFVFYIHPWEVDPHQPRISGAGLKSRFRHYLNLSRTEKRLRYLLRDFNFSTIRDVIA